MARELAPYTSVDLLAELQRRKAAATSDISLASEALRLFADDGNIDARFSQIVDLVCAEFGCARQALLGCSRYQELVAPRHTAMYLMRTMTKAGTSHIARFFSKDHASISHGVNRIREDIKSDPDLRKRINKISQLASGGGK